MVVAARLLRAGQLRREYQLVAALANAINIIDNSIRLALMVAFMMFGSLEYVAFQTHDLIVLSAPQVMMGAVMGFFIWNFPAGLIFLDDGGAYFIGFMLGELSIMLVMRNRDESAWYPVLLFMYPIFETCFSIYRKKFIRGMLPGILGIPDGVHLHMLVYKRLMRWAVGARADAAQSAGVALFVAALPDRRGARDAVLSAYAASVLLCHCFCGNVCLVVCEYCAV
jgi:UDP-N-acetylmuramyl pentapeptide phosphotransferase/UDP-N-acetylglucosamine-1-phosphate transferase